MKYRMGRERALCTDDSLLRLPAWFPAVPGLQSNEKLPELAKHDTNVQITEKYRAQQIYIIIILKFE